MSTNELTPQHWLSLAYCFDLGTCPLYKRHIEIEARDQLDGKRLWVFKMERSEGWVLGKDAQWYWEPRPSSRTDEFIQLTRFNSPQESFNFWRENITEAKPLKIH